MVALASFVLAALAIATPWWSESISSAHRAETVNFLPGTTYAVTCIGSACGSIVSSDAYSVTWGGWISSLYSGIQGLAVAAAVLAAITALLTVLWVTRRGPLPPSPVLARIFGLASAGLLLAAVGWVTGAQPGAFGAGVDFPGTDAGGTSPANTFWGSSSASGVSASWGAGVGWGCALASAVGLILFLVLATRLARTEAATPVRSRAARRPGGTAVSGGYAPPPTSGSRAGPLAARPAGVVTAAATTPVTATRASPPPSANSAETVACPTCGFLNLARAKKCSYCQRPMA